MISDLTNGFTNDTDSIMADYMISQINSYQKDSIEPYDFSGVPSVGYTVASAEEVPILPQMDFKVYCGSSHFSMYNGSRYNIENALDEHYYFEPEKIQECDPADLDSVKKAINDSLYTISDKSSIISNIRFKGTEPPKSLSWYIRKAADKLKEKDTFYRWSNNPLWPIVFSTGVSDGAQCVVYFTHKEDQGKNIEVYTYGNNSDGLVTSLSDDELKGGYISNVTIAAGTNAQIKEFVEKSATDLIIVNLQKQKPNIGDGSKYDVSNELSHFSSGNNDSDNYYISSENSVIRKKDFRDDLAQWLNAGLIKQYDPEKGYSVQYSNGDTVTSEPESEPENDNPTVNGQDNIVINDNGKVFCVGFDGDNKIELLDNSTSKKYNKASIELGEGDSDAKCTIQLGSTYKIKEYSYWSVKNQEWIVKDFTDDTSEVLLKEFKIKKSGEDDNSYSITYDPSNEDFIRMYRFKVKSGSTSGWFTVKCTPKNLKGNSISPKIISSTSYDSLKNGCYVSFKNKIAIAYDDKELTLHNDHDDRNKAKVVENYDGIPQYMGEDIKYGEEAVYDKYGLAYLYIKFTLAENYSEDITIYATKYNENGIGKGENIYEVSP